MLPAFREAGRGQFAVFKVAGSTGVLPVEQVLIGPLEVEPERQGFAHNGITEYLPPGVHRKRLHACGTAMFDSFGFRLTGFELIATVGGCPVLGG